MQISFACIEAPFNCANNNAKTDSKIIAIARAKYLTRLRMFATTREFDYKF